MSSTPKIKICCIMSKDEAKLAIEAGAYALGLVSEMPSGPGVISDELIAQIASSVPKDIFTFLLTSKQDAESIIKQHQQCKTTSIQLVDTIPFDDLIRLRAALQGIHIIQVIHVQDESALDFALEIEPYVDIILLDSGNPSLNIKQLGGTGKTHNWQISRKIVKQTTKPVFLAGGLSPLNVKEATKLVRPFGLDICSGVRSNGRLDPLKLTDFFNEVSW